MLDSYEQVKNGCLEVHLHCRDLGDQEAQQIANALINPDTKVESLDVGCCNIGVVGVMALAKALLVNATLQELHLEFNKVGDESAIVLAEALGMHKFDTPNARSWPQQDWT